MKAPTRREFLRDLGLGAGVLLLAACGQAAQPAAALPAAAPRRRQTRGRRHAPAAATTPRPRPLRRCRAAKSNGTKLTIWGWQSFTPEGDKALGDQMQAWGAANKTQVEYVVVENAQFPQKLAAAVEAKAPPDVVMLTAASNVLDYASRDLLADVSDVWKDTSTQSGGFWSFVDPLYKIGSTYYGIPFEAETSPLFARVWT